jgi:mannose-1-phosphate guanylyltransferase
MPNVYAVIMAGGVGSRFWPRSTEKTPKQLLEIVNRGTMIQNTVARMTGVIEPSKILIVTNKVQRPTVARQLPQIPAENIIVEPIGRNTAPCIGLAALFIRRMDPDAVMVVLPADHLMQDEDEFRRVLSLAIWVAYESGKLITIGIQPSRPETGYGYIQVLDENDGTNPYLDRGIYKVKTFAEKPNRETAQKFLESGDFLWNSGMFIWKVDTILRELRHSIPELSAELEGIDGAIGTNRLDLAVETGYRRIRGISIDYGVMEKAREVYVLRGEFGWSDVGSWDEVYRISGKDADGNSVSGKTILHGTKNSLIYAGDKIVAAVDVEDLIIIASENSILVCRRGDSQDVKEVVDYLRRKQMTDYL